MSLVAFFFDLDLTPGFGRLNDGVELSTLLSASSASSLASSLWFVGTRSFLVPCSPRLLEPCSDPICLVACFRVLASSSLPSLSLFDSSTVVKRPSTSELRLRATVVWRICSATVDHCWFCVAKWFSAVWMKSWRGSGVGGSSNALRFPRACGPWRTVRSGDPATVGRPVGVDGVGNGACLV